MEERWTLTFFSMDHRLEDEGLFDGQEEHRGASFTPSGLEVFEHVKCSG